MALLKLNNHTNYTSDNFATENLKKNPTYVIQNSLWYIRKTGCVEVPNSTGTDLNMS